MDYQNQDDNSLLTFWAGLNHQITLVINRMSPEDLSKIITIQDENLTLEYIIYDYVGHFTTPFGANFWSIGCQFFRIISGCQLL